MGLSKDYVLTVAQGLLLEPLTADYETYEDALKRLTISRECWGFLVRDGRFPAMQDIQAKLESMTLDTPVVDGVPVEFIYRLYRGRDSVRGFRRLMQDTVATYLSVARMDRDFNGEPWDAQNALTAQDMDSITTLLECERGKLLQAVDERLRGKNITDKLPDYISALADAGLIKPIPGTPYWELDSTQFKGVSHKWYSRAVKALDQRGVPAKWELFADPQTGLIRKHDGTPYAPGSFKHVIKTK